MSRWIFSFFGVVGGGLGWGGGIGVVALLGMACGTGLGPVSIYPKDIFEMVADRNAASSLAESSQRRLLLIETHPWWTRASTVLNQGVGSHCGRAVLARPRI